MIINIFSAFVYLLESLEKLKLFKRYEKNNEEFRKRVEECISKCKKKLYEVPPINADDSHAIKYAFFFLIISIEIELLNLQRFNQLNEDSYKCIKEAMMNYLNDAN